ncbi:MAG: T9SS type A sorting domain-containing protein [Flavobacteriia bacterium]|jgi:hypothetical protein
MKNLALFISLLSFLNIKAQYSCATAVPITNGFTSGIVTSPGTSTSSTESWVASVSTDGNTQTTGFTNPDVYTYRYTTGSVAGESFYFTIECDYAVDGEHSIGVWTGCTGTTLNNCLVSTYKFDNVVGICAKNLSANTTYYIGVGKEWASSSNTASGIASRKLKYKVVDFTVETSLTIPSDECNTAALINVADPYQGSTRCTYTASAGSPSTFPNSCGSIENDSWMRFTAGSSTVVIDYEVFNCTNGDGVQLSVFRGSCGSLTMLSGSCINYAADNSTGTWTFTGLSINQTYYIRTDGYAGDLCSYSFNPVSGVVILPIELTDFKGETLPNGFNKLTWKTYSESNSSHFELEKSYNGSDFMKMETIQAAGNSSTIKSYLHLDKAESSQTCYYRLKMVDLNGSFRYSEVISLTNLDSKEISVYPNPSSSGFFSIDLNGNTNFNEVFVYSNIGNEVNHISLEKTSTSLNLSELKNGMYIIKIVGLDQIIEKRITIAK